MRGRGGRCGLGANSAAPAKNSPVPGQSSGKNSAALNSAESMFKCLILLSRDWLFGQL
jgi:hypothetical protein